MTISWRTKVYITLLIHSSSMPFRFLLCMYVCMYCIYYFIIFRVYVFLSIFLLYIHTYMTSSLMAFINLSIHTYTNPSIISALDESYATIHRAWKTYWIIGTNISSRRVGRPSLFSMTRITTPGCSKWGKKTNNFNYDVCFSCSFSFPLLGSSTVYNVSHVAATL